MSFVPQSLRRLHRRKTPLQAYKESRQRFFRPYKVSNKALNSYARSYQPTIKKEEIVEAPEVSMSALDDMPQSVSKPVVKKKPIQVKSEALRNMPSRELKQEEIVEAPEVSMSALDEPVK